MSYWGMQRSGSLDERCVADFCDAPIAAEDPFREMCADHVHEVWSFTAWLLDEDGPRGFERARSICGPT